MDAPLTSIAVISCHYCNDVATTRDHVRPRSSTAEWAQAEIPTVPCCRDCNCKILKSAPLFTDTERGVRVAAVLGGRILKIGPPKWTEEEANEELRGNLRRRIVAYVRKYRVLKDRAQWATARWVKEDA